MALTYIVSSFVEAISGVRVELCVFVVAFMVHLLVFGRYRIAPRAERGSLVKGAGRAKHVPLVKHTGEEKRVQNATDCESAAGAADVATYTATIKKHLISGSLGHAQRAVDQMKEAGLKPDCITFNELMDAVIKSDADKAWSLLDDMSALGVKPDHITCSILLKAIRAKSAGNRIKKIFEIIDSIDHAMDEVLLSSVVEACIRAGRTDLLIPHLKKQKVSKGMQIRGAHTYGSIIRAYGFNNDISGAWDTWREMRKLKVVPSSITLGCMVEALVTSGDPEAGYELIQEMLRDEDCKHLINAVIYCSVVKGFSHQKKFHRVWAVYEEMISQPELVQFSIVTFNALVDACARSGDMDRVPGLLENMVAQGILPNLITYSAILKAYCQENRLDEAFKLVEDMMKTTSFKPDEIMYNTLLDGCARQGLFDRGMQVLKEMESVGVSPTNFTLSVLVKLAGRAKQLERAFQLCDELAKKYRFRLNIHVFNNLIQACIQQRDIPRAISVLARAVHERVRPDVRTYTLLVRACIASGFAEDAAALLRGALGLQKGLHKALASLPIGMLQPQGGLHSDFISEVVEGIAKAPCNNDSLALCLFKELRSKPGIKVDPRLQMRLTVNAGRGH